MNRTGISEKVFEISGGILKRMPVWAENSPEKGGNPQEDTCMGRKMPGKEVIRDGGYVIVFIGYCIYHSRY